MPFVCDEFHIRSGRRLAVRKQGDAGDVYVFCVAFGRRTRRRPLSPRLKFTASTPGRTTPNAARNTNAASANPHAGTRVNGVRARCSSSTANRRPSSCEWRAIESAALANGEHTRWARAISKKREAYSEALWPAIKAQSSQACSRSNRIGACHTTPADETNTWHTQGGQSFAMRHQVASRGPARAVAPCGGACATMLEPSMAKQHKDKTIRKSSAFALCCDKQTHLSSQSQAITERLKLSLPS